MDALCKLAWELFCTGVTCSRCKDNALSEFSDLFQHACETSHFQNDSLLFPLLAAREGYSNLSLFPTDANLGVGRGQAHGRDLQEQSLPLNHSVHRNSHLGY